MALFVDYGTNDLGVRWPYGPVKSNPKRTASAPGQGVAHFVEIPNAWTQPHLIKDLWFFKQTDDVSLAVQKNALFYRRAPIAQSLCQDTFCTDPLGPCVLSKQRWATCMALTRFYLRLNVVQVIVTRVPINSTCLHSNGTNCEWRLPQCHPIDTPRKEPYIDLYRAATWPLQLHINEHALPYPS